MHIIAVDDERPALKSIGRAIKAALPNADLHCFDMPSVALEHARKDSVDVAFLDVRMGGMDGLTLAKRLKEINPKTNIMFSTAYNEYAVDAFGVQACDYLMKPVTVKAVRNALEHLRNPIAMPEQKLRVQCFGSFDVFVGDSPRLYFPRSKSKELLAYLIHKKGASCTIEELVAVLFEDREDFGSLNRQMQTIISTMRKVLRDAGVEGVIAKGYNSIAVDTGKLDCDYYRFLKQDTDAINHYMGEYMINYTWADLTTAYLDRKIG
jgi:two-component SAPR family response regulator